LRAWFGSVPLGKWAFSTWFLVGEDRREAGFGLRSATGTGCNRWHGGRRDGDTTSRAAADSCFELAVSFGSDWFVPVLQTGRKSLPVHPAPARGTGLSSRNSGTGLQPVEANRQRTQGYASNGEPGF
jgi:hypothetical protein